MSRAVGCVRNNEKNASLCLSMTEVMAHLYYFAFFVLGIAVGLASVYMYFKFYPHANSTPTTATATTTCNHDEQRCANKTAPDYVVTESLVDAEKPSKSVVVHVENVPMFTAMHHLTEDQS